MMGLNIVENLLSFLTQFPSWWGILGITPYLNNFNIHKTLKISMITSNSKTPNPSIPDIHLQIPGEAHEENS